jgi:V-type H+-transporting ATPase subunit C
MFQARENKFTVRDFVYNPEELQAGKNELTKLATDKKKQFGPLVKTCVHNFTDFKCHQKSLKVD